MSKLLKNIEVGPGMITPGLLIEDEAVAYWYSQVTLRLRREIAWCWHQRIQQTDPNNGILPPIIDAAAENLDLVRYESQKINFFKTDTASRFLTQQIEELPIESVDKSRWGLIVAHLSLDDAEQFVLALALSARLDSGFAPVFATCLNDLSRPFPTLSLAQRLWDDPLSIIGCADPEHPLFCYGLITGIRDVDGGNPWQRALNMSAMVAQQLIDKNAHLPKGLKLLKPIETREISTEARLLVARLMSTTKETQIVPLLGPQYVAFRDWAATLAKHVKRDVIAVEPQLLQDQHSLLELACICWIRDCDVLLPEEWLHSEKSKILGELLAATQSIPLRWYLPITESSLLKLLPAHLLTPSLRINGLDFKQRVENYNQALGIQSSQMKITVEECARRFRFQEQMIDKVANTFVNGTVPLTTDNLMAACANEATFEIGNLAQAVKPRFTPDELILPVKETQQFKDILHAVKTLTIVHYHWGTAKVWNESGLSVLFCGPPGTGKTMAAEALACTLKLPIYRVDLSQVVNKYIGETEKNLRRIFDAAELSDCILFFDEADALFGKRTEVKDAHDRFANIEISYLLERMERFKGLAILATNRRKDLDEAFMRRLRYVIEFPLPGIKERKRIWKQVFPSGIDTSELDFHYLAKQFQLSGGHIRSIAFNACLRAANVDKPDSEKRLEMKDVLMAVKRELEKMNRTANEELFGNYRHVLKEIAA